MSIGGWRHAHRTTWVPVLERGRLVISLLALAWLLAQPGPALAQQATTIRLAPVSGTPISGTATIAGRDGGATVTVDVTGLAPSASYPVTLHAGTCARPSASAGRLGTLVADSAGRATLTTTRVTASAAGVPVALTLADLADGPHQLTIQGPAGPVACGAIEGLALPARPGMPRTGAGGEARPLLGPFSTVLPVLDLLLVVLGAGGLAGAAAWRGRRSPRAQS